MRHAKSIIIASPRFELLYAKLVSASLYGTVGWSSLNGCLFRFREYIYRGPDNIAGLAQYFFARVGWGGRGLGELEWVGILNLYYRAQ